MSHVIAQACIDVKSGECVDVCPVDCIHPKPDEAKFGSVTQLFIDRDVCIDCGACVTVCPVSAIFPEAEVPADQKVFSQINNAYYRGGSTAPPPTAAAAPVAAAPKPVAAASAPTSAVSQAPGKKIELVQVRPVNPPEEGDRDAVRRERETQKKAPVLLDRSKLFG
jgi:NAD-dependent dihydropyrimidine dehydrogenase PreA subunit